MYQTPTRWWDRQNPTTSKLVKRLKRTEAVLLWLAPKLQPINKVPLSVLVVAAMIFFSAAAPFGTKSLWYLLPIAALCVLAVSCPVVIALWRTRLLKVLRRQHAFMQVGDPEWDALTAALNRYGLDLPSVISKENDASRGLLVEYLRQARAAKAPQWLHIGQSPEEVARVSEASVKENATAIASEITEAWDNATRVQ